MRLIDADKLSETIQDSINLMESKGVDCITARWIKIIVDNVPTEEAVPLKPLARWLAGYAFPPELKAQEIVASRGRDIHEIADEGWEAFLRGMDWAQPDLRDGWTEEHHERDCRDCVEWETCPVGNGAHERGATIGYSAGECPDFRRADE